MQTNLPYSICWNVKVIENDNLFTAFFLAWVPLKVFIKPFDAFLAFLFFSGSFSSEPENHCRCHLFHIYSQNSTCVIEPYITEILCFFSNDNAIKSMLQSPFQKCLHHYLPRYNEHSFHLYVNFTFHLNQIWHFCVKENAELRMNNNLLHDFN